MSEEDDALVEDDAGAGFQDRAFGAEGDGEDSYAEEEDAGNTFLGLQYRGQPLSHALCSTVCSLYYVL